MRFLLGQISAEALLESASFSQPQVQARRRCQALFYIGAMLLSEGDTQGYKEYLGLALAEEFNLLEVEYHLAQAELQALA